jgi:hypothetical protein
MTIPAFDAIIVTIIIVCVILLLIALFAKA